MENKLVIPFGDKKIVAEINDWKDDMPKELVVYLCDKDDCIIQDICLVRGHYEYKKDDGEFEIYKDFIDCLVWGDSGDEDYTNKYVIGVHEEEEE